MTDRKMKVGLLLNPKAGVGGPVGLKGSDGVYGDAIRLGGQSKVAERAKSCIERIAHDGIEWFTVPGEMGGDIFEQLGIPCYLAGGPIDPDTSAENTRHCVPLLCEQGIDLLLFAFVKKPEYENTIIESGLDPSFPRRRESRKLKRS